MQHSTPTRFPLAELNNDTKTAAYIAVLERKMMYQQLLITQYRALLEALTGETYDQIDTRMSADGLRRTAASSFERNLNRDLRQAEEMVEANLAAANDNQLEIFGPEV